MRTISQRQPALGVRFVWSATVVVGGSVCGVTAPFDALLEGLARPRLSCVGQGEGVWLERCSPKGRASSSTGSLVQTLTDHTIGVTSVAFSPDGQWIVSGSWSSDTVRIWQSSGGMHGDGCMDCA